MEDEAMIIKDPAGNRHEANLTTAHGQNSYGQPVLVIDGDAYGPGDIQGWEIVEASDEEWDAFRQAGYLG
jgi:disulfide oxidoreductase YuzD